MLQNGQTALDFLRYKKIKLVNIRAEDIVDGNPKLTLGLIWTIILHFQVSRFFFFILFLLLLFKLWLVQKRHIEKYKSLIFFGAFIKRIQISYFFTAHFVSPVESTGKFFFC